MVEFEQTPRRMEIVRALTTLIEEAESASELVNKAGYRMRARRLLHAAQEFSSQRSLLAQDWRDEDIKNAQNRASVA